MFDFLGYTISPAHVSAISPVSRTPNTPGEVHHFYVYVVGKAEPIEARYQTEVAATEARNHLKASLNFAGG